ncbi:MAG: F0F1 ATP synthase subunit A [Muribaculaceae bacterium]|nr:F0F1 ATP synthase subunit A [Muribaculaceae bacterium]
MKQLKALILCLVCAMTLGVAAARAEGKPERAFDPKEIIFDHLGDGYGWEVPFDHHHRIPLPVMVWAADGSFHCFSSAHVDHHAVYDQDGYSWTVPAQGDNKGKVVQILPDGSEVKPKFDISITKNVCALWIAVLVTLAVCMPVARWHKKHGFKAPRGFVGAIEQLMEFIYKGVIKPTLKQDSRRFAPYLLTVFMFIFIMNLLGLMVIFPGGANLTGNIAVTLVLSLITFFCTNLFARKHYWKEIFWPDVPLFLKFPIPIMQVIELFGALTKPASLTVRLFANMMGGHMIVIVLTLIIFIMADFGSAAVTGLATGVSFAFSLFMLLLDVLVSFIQAFVFTMLSTTFIAMAQERGHDQQHHTPAPQPAVN